MPQTHVTHKSAFLKYKLAKTKPTLFKTQIIDVLNFAQIQRSNIHFAPCFFKFRVTIRVFVEIFSDQLLSGEKIDTGFAVHIRAKIIGAVIANQDAYHAPLNGTDRPNIHNGHGHNVVLTGLFR